MNILFPYMARWRSANWTRYHALFTEFAKLGHKIYVIEPPSLKSPETNFIDLDVSVHENIKIITLENPPLWNFSLPYSKVIKKGIYILKLSKIIENLVEKYNIDILFIYNLPHYILAKKLKGKVKIVFDIADDLPEMLVHELPLAKTFIKKIANTYMHRIEEISDLVITVSEGLKKKTIKDSFIIPNGVDLSLLDKRKAIQKKEKVVGFVGSFEYFVDFDLIFYLIENLKYVKFMLVGGGRLFTRVKDIVISRKYSNVTLTGAVKHEDICNYLNKFDIALLPFVKSELTDNACPIKLFEYALFQIPIVSRDLKEVKIIGKDFVNFYKNKKEALNLLLDVLNNPERYKEKTLYGLDAISEKYNWRSISKEYLKLIRNI